MGAIVAKNAGRANRGAAGPPSHNGATVKKQARHAADRLISGKLRPKAARRGAANRTVSVDGTEYVWSYRHGWKVWGKDLQVLSLSVALHPARTRELVLDFALEVDIEEGPPSEARVLRALESGIREARAVGWDPESRGRAFRYEITEGV
jgi:hypothetical protein